jgi:carbonic anhydrase
MCTFGRRSLLGLAPALPLLAARVARGQEGDEDCVAFDQVRQGATTPDQALQRLMDGNARLLAGRTVNCDLLEQIEATSAGQAPHTAVVGCIDSRVPPELVFDQRLGDLFAARIAGNFVNTDIIGSLEFATKVAGARLIVVLGHSACGAVKGAIDGVELGNLTATLANLLPAVEATAGFPGEQRSSKNAAFVRAVAETNARLAARMLVERSPVLPELVAAGSLKVVAAMHDVATGRVTLLG